MSRVKMLWRAEKRPWKYQLLESEDIETEVYRRRPNRRRLLYVILGTIAIISLSFGAYGSGFFSPAKLLHTPLTAPYNGSHSPPALRREWRSLSREEKQEYLDAVTCLMETPSRTGETRSLYHDFPYVHSKRAKHTHFKTGFVPWHRYFIHLYEVALRNDCGYSGHLVYWDWTQDWKDISQAPIWSSEDGFGSDGNPSVGEDIQGGHCVCEGPFANLTLELLGTEVHPHCLSRGFLRGDGLQLIEKALHPDAISKILEHETYEDFNYALEAGPHNAIPTFIQGDFLMFTAPSDPVFFLHHTQLDRLWWMWMQKHPMESLNIAEHNDSANANAGQSNVLHMQGLGPDIDASKVLDTSTSVLNYRY